MTERQLLQTRPYDLLRLGTRKYHVIALHVGPTIKLNVVASFDWPAYQKHFKIAQPPEKHGYRTEAEVENIPMPQVKDWVFDLSGADTHPPILAKRHLALIDRVSV